MTDLDTALTVPAPPANPTNDENNDGMDIDKEKPAKNDSGGTNNGLDVLKSLGSSVSSGATLSQDGKTLTAGDKSVDATASYSISFGGKSCSYSLASIYLQIIDPSQGLMKYRGACKAHSVSDMIKVTDKPTVLGFFFGASQETEGDASTAVPPQTTDTTIASEKRERHRVDESGSKSSSRHHKDRKDRRHHHKDRHHKRSSHAKHDRPSSKDKHRSSKSSSALERKPSKAPITNEELVSNLNIVVGKRFEDTMSEEERHLLKTALQAFTVDTEKMEEDRVFTSKIVANEIPVGDSASILRAGSRQGRDFEKVLELYMESIASSKPGSGTSKHKGEPGSGVSGSKGKPGHPSSAKQPAGPLGKPVIVLPNAMTSPITMWNAKEFFEQALFVPRDKIKTRKQTSITVSRKVGARFGGGPLEYEFVDNPRTKLPPKEWGRIVAVVAQGAAWQFKDWHGRYANPVDLFGNVYGFYINMEGAPVAQELRGWNVKTGRLHRDKRGLDSVTCASFWNGLDEWMSVHKPEYLPKRQDI